MAADASDTNPLVVTGTASDISLTIQLHPLVLLTISDYITRHTLRSQTGPIVGAVIGQQLGHNHTLEFAYECRTVPSNQTASEQTTLQEDGNEIDQGIRLDDEWFLERLESYREVHKDPPLDLVALFVLGSSFGPRPAHVPLISQVQKLTGNDSVLLVVFHGDAVDQIQGGKLPISIYETVGEQDGEHTRTKFRELAFEVDSGDAEMIGVDFVAKGGGNATAVSKGGSVVGAGAVTAGGASTSDAAKNRSKGKTRARDGGGGDEEESGPATAAGEEGMNYLSAEDEELISSLAGRANAIRMLNQRLALIQEYLSTLPESSLTNAAVSDPAPNSTNHVLLRSIGSMVARLSLLSPPTSSTTASDASGSSAAGSDGRLLPTTQSSASEREQQDVHLTSLLSTLTRSVAEVQGLASRFHVVQRDRANRDRMNFGRGRPVFDDQLEREGVNEASVMGY